MARDEDNVFVERLWRSARPEEMYLRPMTASLSEPHIDWPLPRLLQRPPNLHGIVTKADPPLIDAEKLFRQPGPPRHCVVNCSLFDSASTT